mgnify:CR=1 FL=1
MTHNQIVGEYLKEIRTDKGYSLQYVADRIGRSRYTYRDYETGETEMYWSMYLKVCSALDIDPIQLSSRVLTDPRLDRSDDDRKK